jgi:hypothetical protein
LGDVHADPSLRPASLNGGRLVYHPDGTRTVTYPSRPMTGRNDLPGLAPQDRAAVKAIHDKTVGPARPVFDALTELTGVPAVARSAVKAIEHPGVMTGLAAAGNAAMLFPGFRPGKAAREAAEIAKAEEATKAAEDVVPGGGLGTPEEVSKKLTKAKQLRRQQDQLYRQERAKRAAAGEQAMQIGGMEGHLAAKAALKGPLPKLEFGGFKNFDKNSFHALITHVQEHPDLHFWEKVRATDAVTGVLNGRVPQPNEIMLLQRVFGENVADNIVKSTTFWDKAKHTGLDIIGVPRSLMSSYDASAPFRQGLLFGVSHPAMFFKNFRVMYRALGKNAYHDILGEIHARPNADLYARAKLSLTDFGYDMKNREEQFPSSIATHIPGVGASGRMYTAFLDKSRADYFDWMVERLQQARPDLDLESPEADKILRTFARVVGNATGRGEFKHQAMREAAPLLNAIFFAPRLVKSRLDVIANPAYYFETLRTPVARQESLKHLFGLVATVSGILYLAKQAGADVEMDPRNADWAKIRIGNTRIDIAAGFQQPLRVIAQVATGTIISSTTGKKMQLAGGFGDISKRDILQRFAETKLSPPASLVNDFFKGTDFEGKPFSWKKAAFTRMIPLLAQDAFQVYQEDGILPAVGGYGLGAFGVGIQTYGPKAPGSSPAPKTNSLYDQRRRGGKSLYQSGGSDGSRSLYR